MRMAGWIPWMVPIAAAAAPLAGCGGDETPAERPSPRVASADPEARAPEPLPPLPDDFRVGVERAEEADWAALGHAERWMRKLAVDRMLGHGATMDELIRHAAREARHGRDVGLLADLLADHPWEVFPLLLWRVYRSSAYGRSRIAAALGHPRDGSEQAQGLLMHRLLASEFRGEREACIAALAALRGDLGPRAALRDAHRSEVWAPWVLERLVPPHATVATRREDPLARAFLQANDFELDMYGRDAVPALTEHLAAGSITPMQALVFAVELADRMPGSDLPARLLARGGEGGFIMVRDFLREHRRLRTALAAAPHLGARVTELLPGLLALLDEPGLRLPLLASLSQCDADARPRIQAALLADWERRRAAGAVSAPYELDEPSLLLLRLLRPRGAVLDAFVSMLDDRELRWLALDMLTWAHPSARERASTAIRAFSARMQHVPDLSRHQRKALEGALPTLARDHAWFVQRREHILHEDAPFAAYLPARTRADR